MPSRVPLANGYFPVAFTVHAVKAVPDKLLVSVPRWISEATEWNCGRIVTLCSWYFTVGTGAELYRSSLCYNSTELAIGVR